VDTLFNTLFLSLSLSFYSLNILHCIIIIFFSESTTFTNRGTFSKQSHILNGRRPFSKDYKIFNYDFDNESESSKEHKIEKDVDDELSYDVDYDGDMIATTATTDKLEYDDFVRPDDDLGSDADSDEKMVATTAIKNQEVLESIGPCFLSHKDRLSYLTPATSTSTSVSVIADHHAPTDIAAAATSTSTESNMLAIKLDSHFQPVPMGIQETDVVRLQTYGSVVYIPQSLKPFLGDT
jgi:hypothetical protein